MQNIQNWLFMKNIYFFLLHKVCEIIKNYYKIIIKSWLEGSFERLYLEVIDFNYSFLARCK